MSFLCHASTPDAVPVEGHDPPVRDRRHSGRLPLSAYGLGPRTGPPAPRRRRL